MLKPISLASAFLTALAVPAFAEPPADLDQCLELSGKIAKSAGAKINSQADYIKFHFKFMDLNSACGLKDFAGAEKIANDIKATFKLD